MKKELTSNNFIKQFLIITFSLLVAIAAIVIFFDPFYHYHKPLPFLKAVLWEKEYQVPGTLDHFDYDAVIAGSSVAENNNNYWYDERFGCKSIKAIRSYGPTADLCYFINRAFDNQDLKYVFLNLDPSSLNQEAETTFALTGSPLYLYDDNPVNDIEYLLNKDVIFERIPYVMASSFIGDYNEGESYNWAQWKAFNRDTILYHYIQSPVINEMAKEDEYIDLADKNISLIEDILKAHPETEFYIFIPPYSILWWDNLYRDGDTVSYLYMEEYAIKKLLNYENVRVFNFQNATEVIYNLDYYTDSLHFSPEINHFICDSMADGLFEIKNEEDLEASFKEIYEYAINATDYVEENYKDEIKVGVLE